MIEKELATLAIFNDDIVIVCHKYKRLVAKEAGMDFKNIIQIAQSRFMSAEDLIFKIVAEADDYIFSKENVDPEFINFLSDFLSIEYIYNSKKSDMIFSLFFGVEHLFKYEDLKAFLIKISENFEKFDNKNFALMYCALIVSSLSKNDCIKMLNKLLDKAKYKHLIIAINVCFDDLIRINSDSSSKNIIILKNKLNEITKNFFE